jgi:DNA topoisomerase-1
VTLEQALEQFRLPRMLGEYEGQPVTIGTGKFGPYVLHRNKYTSLPKDMDPMSITIVDAVRLIEEKRKQEKKRHLKFFPEDEKLEVMDGRFGPYLAYDGKNYRLPKAMHERADQLTYDECMDIIRKSER